MQLADREGRLSRWEEMLDELTPRQVIVLMAYQSLHPSGEEREDWRQAILTAAICSSVKFSGEAVDPADLLKLLKPPKAKKKVKKERDWISPSAAAANVTRKFAGGKR